MPIDKDDCALQIVRGKQVLVHVPLWNFPDGQLRECYETDTEIIVLGDPTDEDHNCDEMGCSSCFHVLYRFKKDEEDKQ